MKGSCLREQPLECARLMVAGVETHRHAGGVCSHLLIQGYSRCLE